MDGLFVDTVHATIAVLLQVLPVVSPAGPRLQGVASEEAKM
jgi:hypothetical protein